MARAEALAAALAAAILAAAGAGGAATQQPPQRGGTVIFGSITEFACMNVLVARCSPDPLVLPKVLEPAFDVGPDFTFRPRLVSRVTVTSSPPFTLTYRIRAEAQWSDGVPVTARDFVFTHEARVAHRVALGPEDREALGHVRRVTAAGPKTVRVVLRSRFAGWHTLFGSVLPAHVLDGRDLSKVWIDGIDDPRTGEPIGSGPFLLDSWNRGREFVLARNPRYWGPHPAFVDRLVIPFDIGDTLSAFRKGKVDIAWGVLPEEVPALRREPNLRVTSPPSSYFDQLSIRVARGGHPALRNRLVRQAIAFGIDRAGLAGAQFGFTPTRSLDSVVYLVQSPYYESNWRRYRPRPALGRRLLGQAGCRRGADGIYVCAGNRLSFRFITTAGVPPREQALKSIQVQLRKVGIEVVPTYASSGALFDSILPRGTYDVALHGWGFDPNPTQASTLFGCRAQFNWTGYCSRGVQRGLDRAARTLDADGQARILNRVDVQVSRDVPMIPLFQIHLSTALRRSIRNFELLSHNPLADSENWWLDR